MINIEDYLVGEPIPNSRDLRRWIRCALHDEIDRIKDKIECLDSNDPQVKELSDRLWRIDAVLYQTCNVCLFVF